MRVLIDVADPLCHEAFFGLTLLERHLRVLGRGKGGAGIAGPIILSGPLALPSLPGVRPELEIRQEEGSLGQRVRRALADSPGPLLVIDGATLVDPRLIAFLLKGQEPAVALHGEGRERAGILRLTPDLADATAGSDSVLALGEALVAVGRAPLLAPDAMPGFIANLRRSEPYWLFALPDESSRRQRARWLFRINYKGSTDFLTRWVFPPLVWPLVRLATRWHIHPNWITGLSVLLAFGVVPLFALGEWFWGFLLAYVMCVLDSVDGKVARLTLTDSKLGNILDHGLDIVHPPLWYAAWAWGLGARGLGDPLTQAALWLIGFYVADRLVLGVAKARFKRGLHSMTRLDGQVRLWIARRNVNMAIMTVALLLNEGAAGFFAVAAWQGVTLLWHTLRTAMLQPGTGGVEATRA